MKGESVSYSVDSNWGVNNLLPINRSFYYYLGSNVFPPCKSDVKWIVLKEAVDILYNDLIPFINFAGKPFEGSDGILYSLPMRDIQPNPSFVSGKKVERIIYENNNSNNGNIKKEKIYIKCQKIKKNTSSSTTSSDSSDSSKKFITGGFFNSTFWKVFTYLCYLIVYVIGIYITYKTVKSIYESGKMMNWSNQWSGGNEVCISKGEFEENFPCNSNNPVVSNTPLIPSSQIDYKSPSNQEITKNAIKSDTQFLKEMLNFGEQTATISGGGTDNYDGIFPSIKLDKGNINMDIKDISS